MKPLFLILSQPLCQSQINLRLQRLLKAFYIKV